MSRGHGVPNRATGARAQRRAQGFRGKAPKPPEPFDTGIRAAMVKLRERAVRNEARKKGLIIPPSAEEARIMRTKGHNVGAGGLVLPPPPPGFGLIDPTKKA